MVLITSHFLGISEAHWASTRQEHLLRGPGSYWYLQHFPISKMAGEVDYVVYMTYDLHGQWDYGNVWSQEGCADGNCLRSHVNLTETMYTLAMITKATCPHTKSPLAYPATDVPLA